MRVLWLRVRVERVRSPAVEGEEEGLVGEAMICLGMFGSEVVIMKELVHSVGQLG
jgi:hypothetical protein